MSKFKAAILIFGLLTVCIAASLATLIALSFSGALVTEPVELVFVVADNEKFYDGEPLVPEKYLMEGELFNGHTVASEFTGSQTGVGVGTSGMNVKIVDEYGFDVTNEYSISVIGGKLTVEKSSVLIYLNAQEVIYSGETYIFDNYTVIAGSLAEGHKPGAAFVGKGLVNVGDIMTSQDAWPAVFDAAGRDVSENYDILFSMGEVRIAPRPLSVRPVGGEKIYDGKPLSCERYEIVSGSLALGHYAEVNFVGEEGGEAQLTSAGDIKVYADVTIRNAAGEDVTSNYALNVSEAATLRVNPRELILTAKSGTFEYNGKVQSFSGDHVAYTAIGLVSGESVSVIYDGEISNAGSVDNVISGYEISSGNQNYTVTTVSGKITVTKANISVKLASEELTYGSDIVKPEDYIILEPELPEGFGFNSNIKEVLKEINEVGKNAYTITEYSIYDSYGDRTSNFNVAVSAGIITVVPKEVVINISQSKTYQKVYDGQPFEFELSDVAANGLNIGHKISSYKCTQLVNASDDLQNCYVTSVSVSDRNGVDVSRNYSFSYNSAFAQVTITKRPLTLSTGSLGKVYDGKELSGGGITAEGLAFGDYISLTSQSGITDAGAQPNEPEYKILNSNGDIAKDNYNVTEQFGMLTVSKKTVNVGINNLVKEYGESVTEEQLKELLTGCDENISKENFRFNGITETPDAGSYVLTAEYVEDLQNYSVVVSSGMLTVNKKKINVNITGGNKTYDGKAVTANDLGYSSDFDGVQLVVTDCNLLNIKDCGTYPAYASFAVADGNGANYEINVTGGTFTISEAEVILRYEEQSKVYDGTPFTVDCNDISVYGLEGLKVSAIEYRKIVTVSQSGYLEMCNPQFVLNGEPVSSSNFKVTLPNAATVTIEKKKINLYLENIIVSKDIDDRDLEDLIYSIDPIPVGALASTDYSDSCFMVINTDDTLSVFNYGEIINTEFGEVTDCYEFVNLYTVTAKVIKV